MKINSPLTVTAADPRLLSLSIVLMLAIFVIDLQLPLGVAGGVPYIAVILLSLWHPSDRYIALQVIACSILIVAGYYLSPQGGELWQVLVNRFLALFAVWITALFAVMWKRSEKKVIQLINQSEQEKENIYTATIQGSQHITYNLLNQLKLVEMEVKKHPDFDQQIAGMFTKMLADSNALMKELSAVENVSAESIRQSVYPKEKS